MQTLSRSQIHHAPFLSEDESYMTLLGADDLRYDRTWQEQLSDPKVDEFWYAFCRAYRDIGLTQVYDERFDPALSYYVIYVFILCNTVCTVHAL